MNISVQSKEIKSRSCQNSVEKTDTKNGIKTLRTGSSTQRNHNSTMLKRPKK